jgi:hypothetical protein
MKTLGMIVTSDRYPEQVWSLVRTARKKNIDLYIHLTGPGVRLVRSEEFNRLTAAAIVTICSDSLDNHLAGEELESEYVHCLAGWDHMARLIETCDRHIVF